ncbi:MAG: hypothetical protein GKR89_11590 [Candidatus Latescibacteria bacterium]|nr:hypothetical protein [Candidatus Latescibacterota bacterium]
MAFPCWVTSPPESPPMKYALSTASLLVLLAPPSSLAEQIRFDGQADWDTWKIPLGVVQIDQAGRVTAKRFRKNTNAALDAPVFGGGIRRAGSDSLGALNLIDGDLTTGWSPDLAADSDDWFVEIDLGRGVSARRIRLIFDQAAPPFELFDLFLSNGEPTRDQVGNFIEGSLVYRSKKRIKENGRHVVLYEPPELFDNPLQYLRVDLLKEAPGARLVEIEVESIGDDLAVGLLERGGDLSIIHDVTGSAQEVNVGNGRGLVDGSLVIPWNNGSEPRKTYPTWSHITLDLGGIFLIDFVRIIGINFKSYEVLTSDGSLAPDGTLIWHKHFAGHGDDTRTVNGLANHTFPAVPTRFVRLAWLIWDPSCADFFGGIGNNTKWICFARGSTTEVQVFGQGFPRQIGLQSSLIDLGRTQNITHVEWAADTPPGTRVEVRTRTGNEVEERLAYYDKDLREVTQRRWEKLIPSFRGPIDTLRSAGGDWSPWSRAYTVSGAAVQSPSPRRFVELDMRLLSNSGETAASVDWLGLNFSPPIAQETLGEIVPLQVRPGERTQFSYFLRPRRSPNGFDRIAIESSSAPLFRQALLNGDPIEVALAADSTGFRVTLPRRVRSDELVELQFEAAIFLQSTRFDAFLEDSRLEPGIRQPVDPGDAEETVDSSTNIVGLPVASQLFSNVAIAPRLFSPNNDGINDRLHINADLANILEARPLQLRIYDLAGHLLWQDIQQLVAGPFSISWDGRNHSGALVAPGLYLVELSLKGDAQEAVLRRTAAVVY